MKLVFVLLKDSWKIVLLASLVGALSGGATVGLLALIHRALGDVGSSSWPRIWAFVGLCAAVLVTRMVSQLLLTRLARGTISRLTLSMCRRILDTPLARLEEIGSDRMLAALTSDVVIIGHAMNGVPGLIVNAAILALGLVYLLWLSPLLLGCVVLGGALGMVSFRLSGRPADPFLRRGREAQDDLMKYTRVMIEGVSQLKMHGPRREDFLKNCLEPSTAAVHRNFFIGASIQDVSANWGQLLFLAGIGLLLFAWPRFGGTDAATLTGYTLTILYLMSPLTQILAWMPLIQMAGHSQQKIEQLGLMLDSLDVHPAQLAGAREFSRVELAGVTYAYRRDHEEQGFLLGPIDFAIQPGEVVFVVGGNGSGKTTLLKLLTGLYTPRDGSLLLDGEPVEGARREEYRQLFSAVLSEPVIFERLLGMESERLDERAAEYLRKLELDHKVTVKDGAFSTVDLSRGQRKRLALLAAYLEDRPIYAFDEWAADQDPAFKRVFYREILPDLKQRGKAVVAITHDDRYFSAADRVIKLEEGRAVDVECGELDRLWS